MRPKRKGSIVVAIIAVVAVLAMLTPASAANVFIVAGPGNATLPVYYTQTVVQQKGKPVTFLNLDIAPHDVRHTGGKFFTPVIGIGKKASLIGVKALPKGTYKFFCSIHPIMKGTLRII